MRGDADARGRRWFTILGVGLVVASFVVHVPTRLPYRLNLYDEGYWSDAALRFLAGDTPYRDYHHAYPPGTFLAPAAWMRVAGTGYRRFQEFQLAVQATGAVATFLVGRLLGLRWLALATPLILLREYVYDIRSAVFLVAVLATVHMLVRPARSAATLAGLSTALAFWTGFDVGVVCIVGTFGTFVAYRWIPARCDGTEPHLHVRAWLAAFVPAFVAPFVWYARTGVLAAYADQVFLQPRRMTQHASVPFPPLFPPISIDSVAGAGFMHAVRGASYYVPFVVYPVAGLLALFLLRRSEPSRRGHAIALLFVALVSVGMMPPYLNRSDWWHVVYSLAVGFVLMAATAAEIGPLVEAMRVRRVGRFAAAAIVGYLVCVGIAGVIWEHEDERFRFVPVTLEGNRYWTGYDWAGVASLTRLLEREAATGGRFVTAWDPGLYVLTRTTNPVFLSQIVEGYVTPATEARVLHEIESDPSIRHVILRTPRAWRPGHDLPAYAPRLHAFVVRNFEPLPPMGGLMPYRRRDTR